MFSIERGDKILLIIIGICALLSTCINKLEIVKYNWNTYPWIKWIITLVIFGLISEAYHGFGSRELRALYTVTIFLLFLDLKNLNLNIISTLVFLAATSAAFIAYKYQYITPIGRRMWPVNAIPFASYISLIIGCSAILATHSKTKLVKFIFILSSGISLTALFLTESRGPLFAIICTFSALSIYHIIKGNINLKSIAIFLSMMVCVVYITYPILESRYENTVVEIKKITKGNNSTSIAQRLEVYQVGLSLIQKHPFIGYGKDALPSILDTMLKNKEINKLERRVLGWNFHNNFIEKAVVSGLLGIMTMFLWLGMPLVYGWTKYRQHLPLISTPPLLYFFACLTDTPATNGSSYVVYLVITGLILAFAAEDTNYESIKEPSFEK
ncbi:O-antigen ligase family protein [Vibrio sp. UCD-FRSSP16_30]|uniref:O-antigen ligase family protein n=2 Tax=unclassified Vibrio TaxID=2614977 RepID=UPI001E3684D8|nr:O-antigen ligase family protein [Vibrio sp. UCD-FRSSP16_30]